jgi:chromosome segregation ATPase
MTLRKGTAMWISGFLTFLAALNTFNAVMLWAYHGSDTVIDPYFNILITGGMQVTDYFWVSLIATFGFLGLTSLIAYGRSSPYQPLTQRIGQLEYGLGDTQRKIEDANSELAAKLETDSMKHDKLSDAINTKIDKATKEMLNTIGKQGKFLKRNREDLSSSVKRSLNNMTEEMMGMLEKRAESIQKNLLSATEAHFCNIRNDLKVMLEKQGKALQVVEHSGEQNGAVLQRQMAKLEYVETELEALRIELTLLKPRLDTQKGAEEINGIRPLLGTELPLYRHQQHRRTYQR